MSMDLNQNQCQKLYLGDYLRQSLKILKLSACELDELVKVEIESNPVLMWKDDSGEKPFEACDSSENKRILELSSLIRERKNSRIDVEYINESDLVLSVSSTDERTLYDSLLAQLRYFSLTEEDKLICVRIIGALDDNGYFSADEGKFIVENSLSKEKFHKNLMVVQSFEPAGVGARSLGECLLLQLDKDDPMFGIMSSIIDSFLVEIADRKFGAIARKLGVSEADVASAYRRIRRLNPKPGSVFASYDDIKYIVPDIFIYRRNDSFEILMNETSAPTLNISVRYVTMIDNPDIDSEAKEFVLKRLNSAVELMKAIEERKKTLYGIASTIVELQRDFFEKGRKHIRKMNLSDIASAIGVHESTVSRAISDKYIQCDHGCFELKYFFGSGKESVDGASISSQSIKVIMAEIIRMEGGGKPLSDQDISEILSDRGIPISRRTVAKYREELGIESSTKRKR